MGATDAVRRLDELAGPRLLRVDELCDRFESAWRRGERPCLADYARELPEADRLVAARELIRVEVEYRVRRGEVPLPREYEEADPDLDPSWIEQVIAAELVVDRSDLSAVPPAAGRPEWPETRDRDHFERSGAGPGSRSAWRPARDASATIASWSPWGAGRTARSGRRSTRSWTVSWP